MTKFCVTVKIFQPKVVYGHEKEGENFGLVTMYSAIHRHHQTSQTELHSVSLTPQ